MEGFSSWGSSSIPLLQVCSVSPQAAAITSFFRLLSLPGATLFDLVSNVFTWDLDSTGGVNSGLSILRVGLVSLATPAAPEPSVVLRSPSYLAMQIIIPRAPAFNEQSSPSVCCAAFWVVCDL